MGVEEYFRISKQVELDYGHRVPFHDSGCRFLHGHRGRVVLHVACENLVFADEEERPPDAGMVVDFGVLKEALLSEVHDPFDHTLLLWKDDPLSQKEMFLDSLTAVGVLQGVRFLPCVPTAEELARFWGKRLSLYLRKKKFRGWVTRVEVWETPTSCARWIPMEPA